MNATTLLTLAEKNSADIDAIVTTLGQKVGVTTLLSLMPHIVAIVQTIEGAKAATPAA